MKKTLIALALTALPVASMADVVLYGQIKAGVEVTKVKDTSGTTTQIVDYGSRIGFKGHEHLNGDLRAIWQLEQSVNVGGVGSTFGTRDSFIGLASEKLGTLKAGYLSTPVKELNDKVDIWEASDSTIALQDLADVRGINPSAKLYNPAGLKHFTRGNDAVTRRVAVSYETPNFSGFTAKAYVSPSDNYSSDSDRVQNVGNDSAAYGLSFSYENSGYFADVAGVYVKNGKNNLSEYAAVNNNKSKRAAQLLAQAGYNADNWTAAVAYQHAKHVDAQYDVTSEVAVSGAYRFDNALRLKASAAYGFNMRNQFAEKAYTNGKYYQGIVGADYALSKRTQVNGQVGYVKYGTKKDSNDVTARAGTVSVGLKHKF